MKVVKTFRIEFSTHGPNKLFDITEKVSSMVKGVWEGVLTLQAVGSTGALVILPRQQKVVEAFENDLWDLVATLGWKHPGNAYAHLRSTLIGTTLTLPVVKGVLPLTDCGIYFLENQPAVRRHRSVTAALLVPDEHGLADSAGGCL
ncbi:MAG: YjbQ family protein [Thermofilaceae archaeon]|nr:YjbQ family protein [Thermofilaceae archaeon]MCX8180472.1 YjbQ family protein [Thermofilaceae archaeon]MDW8003331.1 YjbQ family protein [Thermofilaceae archaeon]